MWTGRDCPNVFRTKMYCQFRIVWGQRTRRGRTRKWTEWGEQCTIWFVITVLISLPSHSVAFMCLSITYSMLFQGWRGCRVQETAAADDWIRAGAAKAAGGQGEIQGAIETERGQGTVLPLARTTQLTILCHDYQGPFMKRIYNANIGLTFR